MNRDVDGRARGLQLVEAGDPQLFFELRPSQKVLFADVLEDVGFARVQPSSVQGATVLFGRLQTDAGIVPVWVLHRGTAEQSQLRRLRLCLSRLHAEREVLDLVLKQLKRGRLLVPFDEEAANLLDAYFNEHLRILSRESWGGISQSAVINAFDATLSVVRPAAQADLVQRYQGSRRQVWNKIQEFQERRRATRLISVTRIEEGAIKVDKRVTVSGTGNIVNVGEYISNVTNTVNNQLADSNESDEVKELIAQLTSQIAEVAPQADPSQVKKLGKNLEALGKEAAAEEPDQAWYEVSLKGLKEAAEAVGEVAGPIVSTVSKLTKLLLA